MAVFNLARGRIAVSPLVAANTFAFIRRAARVTAGEQCAMH